MSVLKTVNLFYFKNCYFCAVIQLYLGFIILVIVGNLKDDNSKYNTKWQAVIIVMPMSSSFLQVKC